VSILDRILSHKKKELRALKEFRPLSQLKKEALALPPAGNRFSKALRKKAGPAVIAEIKRRSPSKGLLSRQFDPVRIARSYRAGGAAALSVLTDAKYFGGSSEVLQKVRASSPLPILRKDFILEEYQVYEARLLGADAVLLIAAALSRSAMKKLALTARRLGLDVLFEVHNAAELRKVLPLAPKLLGVNNRNLKTFVVDLTVTERLAAQAPKGCESGIRDFADIQRLQKAGAKAFLVGESLMKEKDPARALKRLLGKTYDPR
jgi:indole-3-glycerol phosphate synthase